jgi:Phage protein Gp138 N-terminal domain
MDRRALLNDSEETTRLALDGRQACMWTAFPGIVQSVNFAQMTCVVQMAIQTSITDENNITTWVDTGTFPLTDVPICFPSAGGFTITMPMKAGDEVLIVIANRCIDAWWQSGGMQKPIEMRMHDLSDGFAIPGPKSLPNVIPNISSTDAQIRNNLGTTFISIAADGSIKMTSPVGVVVDANLSVTGTITATSEVTAKYGSMLPIPLSTHVHPVTTAPGTTGAPT